MSNTLSVRVSRPSTVANQPSAARFSSNFNSETYLSDGGRLDAERRSGNEEGGEDS
jgi:hypothetical protein